MQKVLTIIVGISTFKGTLEYDTNIFENITISNIEELNGWSISYNSEILIAQRSEYINENTPLCKITFKVKSSARRGFTEIKMKEAQTSISRTEVRTEDTSTIIKIEELSVNNYELRDNNIRNVSIRTRVEEFKKYITGGTNINVYDKEGNELKSGSYVGTGMTVKINGGYPYTIIVNGDLNGDGEIDIIDMSKMKQHMINLKELKGESLLAADVNNDGISTGIVDFAIILDVLFGIRTI